MIASSLIEFVRFIEGEKRIDLVSTSLSYRRGGALF